MIGAPRLRAESSSSRIRIPAPSPMTKPSRSMSKGRLATPDGLEGLTNRVRTRAARRNGAVVWATGADGDRNHARAHVRDHHRHGEGTDARGSSLPEDGQRLLDLLQAADRAPHDDADLV